MSLSTPEPGSIAEHLGAAVRVFRPRPWGIGFVVFGGILAVVISVLLLAKPFGPGKPVPQLAALGLAACGMAAALCGMMKLFSLGQRIVIHENGLVVRNLLKTSSTQWEEIESATYHMSKLVLGTEAWLITRDGKKVMLPPMVVGLFAAYTDICDRIKARVLLKSRQRLAAGETVPFGDELGVSRDGLYWQGRLLRWSDVRKLYWGAHNYQPGSAFAVRGIFSISQPTGYEPLLTKDVSNLPILLDMIESDYRVEIERGTAFFK
jgi:hypothetical protein